MAAVSEKTAYKYSKIWAEARDAGLAAGAEHAPTPMIVGSPRVPFLDERIDPTKKVWHVPEGVCGFAWVHLENGRSGFARWALNVKVNEYGHTLGNKAWEWGRYKGVDIWCGEFGQSLERKEKWARAAAEVLRGYGIDASARSRMD